MNPWDFAESFSAAQLACLIQGLDPSEHTDASMVNDPIYRRIRMAYEQLLAIVSCFSLHQGMHQYAYKTIASDPLKKARDDFLQYEEGDPEPDYSRFIEVLGLEAFEKQVFSRAEVTRWLKANGLPSVYAFNLAKSDDGKPLANRERSTLLTIIGLVCKEAKLEVSKPAKTASLILGIAAEMGVSIGESTIEGHLKKVSDALASHMK